MQVVLSPFPPLISSSRVMPLKLFFFNIATIMDSELETGIQIPALPNAFTRDTYVQEQDDQPSRFRSVVAMLLIFCLHMFTF